MDKLTHFAKLQNMYHNAPCNDYYKPLLTVQDGEAELQINIKPEFFHAAGAVHGSVYFKALDDVSFFSANSLIEDVFVLTTNFNVYFTRPITAGIMTAKGRVVDQTRSQILAEAILYNENGKKIGRGSGTFVKSKIELTPEIGYKI